MAIQVYEATKDGQGNSLSVLSRQFISFSYGGKDIEDFGLIATFSNDRLSKGVYSSFEDTITNQTELDGQIFWMSAFKANELSFTLSTDGITEKELENFKRWFIPGTPRELILTEHANRAIIARVAATPTISMLPFEENIEVIVGNQTIATKTSMYKGDIGISFIMDDPFWYAIKSYFEGDLTAEQAKIIYEDEVPHINMLSDGATLLANEEYYDGESIATQAGITLDGATANEAADSQLYYCGSAAAKPTVSFSIQIEFDEDTKVADFPKGSPATLTVGKQTLSFSLPSILVDYNYALETAANFTGTSALDLRKLFRDNMYDYYARAWAIGILDDMINDEERTYVDVSSALLDNFKEGFQTEMRSLFEESSVFSFSINSANGNAILTCRAAQRGEESFQEITENVGNMIKSNYLIIEPSVEKYQHISTTTKMENFTIEYKYMYL